MLGEDKDCLCGENSAEGGGGDDSWTEADHRKGSDEPFDCRKQIEIFGDLKDEEFLFETAEPVLVLTRPNNPQHNHGRKGNSEQHSRVAIHFPFEVAKVESEEGELAVGEEHEAVVDIGTQGEFVGALYFVGGFEGGRGEDFED